MSSMELGVVLDLGCSLWLEKFDFKYYVPGPEHPPSPDYVPGPKEPEQAPHSLEYVPEPEYPEYLAPSDDEAPIEDQPLPVDASPTALSPGYVADSDPDKDEEKDHADYPTDRGDDDDDDDESSDDDDDDDNDDDDDDDEDQEAPDEDEDQEDEHDQLYCNLAGLGYMSDSTLMSAAIEALIAVIPSPPLHVSSPPLPLPPPSVASPTYVEAPLGYRAVRIWMRVVSPPLPLPAPSSPLLLPDIDRESSIAVAARQPGLDVAAMDATIGRPMSREVSYGIENVWDDMVGDIEERAPTLKDLSQRVTDLATTLARDTHETHARHSQEAWSHSINCSKEVHAELQAYQAQTSSLQKQMTTALGRIQTLEARESASTDDPEDASSSS
ncbi:hypothetical protein Tco_0015007 [Tanacetum coccineum]